MSSKSNTIGQIISLPKGGGALHGIGEKFSADLFTGTGNFTVPIALPPGRNGFQPQLNLVYSTGNGNGPFGLGWQLSIPGIMRKTSKGIPQYHDNSIHIKDWDTFVLSGAEDLVPVALWTYKDATADPVKLEKIDNPTEQDFDKAPVIEFRPRTEGLFAHIYHHRYNGNDYWEVRTKDGLTSFYGTPKAAETDDPAVIADPDSTKRRKVFAWKLTQTKDPFGNLIEYKYERDSKEDGPHHWDQLYLSEIRYVDYYHDDDHPSTANRKFLVRVKFSYEKDGKERPDKFSEYRAGFEIRTVKRYKKIEVLTHTDAGDVILTRTHHFVYLDELELTDPACHLPHNGISLLSQIIVEGHDGSKSERLPPLEFDYTKFEPEKKRDFFPITGPDMPPASLANPDYELVDLMGNGLPDILEMNGTVRYWRNLGNQKFDWPQEMQDVPAGIRLADPGVQLIDSNGDGRADLLVTFANGLAGYYPTRFGGVWDHRSFQRYDVAPSFNLKDPEVRLVDLTGDGITDAIRFGSRLECYFNDPVKGWHETRWIERRHALSDFPDVNFSDPRVRLADMSGDGMQDIVLVYDGNIEYWPSLGYGNWGKRISMRKSPHYPYDYDPKRILIGDVDGDGLADIVYVDDRKVTLWINQSGNSWSYPIVIVIKGTPQVSDTDAIHLTDMLGSGISGLLWSTDSNSLIRNNMFFLDFVGGIKPYLLNEMDNHIGAVTRVQYVPSTKFYLEDQKRRETRWKTPLPFPVHVVSRVEVIDEISHGKLTREYHYHHGYWDGIEREFRGFGRVDQQDTENFKDYHSTGLHPEDIRFDTIPLQHFSLPTETRTWFHQGPIEEDKEYGGWQETHFSNEFWSEDPQVLQSPQQSMMILLSNLRGAKRRIKRDALRTLRGRIIRTELYALDGTSRKNRPYTVTEYLHDVMPIPIDKPWTDTDNAYAEESSGIIHQLEESHQQVFFPCTLAERATQWERGNDPKTQFRFMSKYDIYGQAQSQISIAVPRGQDFNNVSSSSDPYLVTHTETKYAKKDNGQRYIVDRVAGDVSYEIKDNGNMQVFTLKQAIEAGAIAPNLKSIISQTLNFYDGPAFQGLSFGEIGNYGALVQTESLVLTDEIVQNAYDNSQPPFLKHTSTPTWPAEYPMEFRTLLNLGGYIYHSGSTNSEYVKGYFVASERRKYDFHGNIGKGIGLVKVKRDPLQHDTAIDYDDYDLLPITVSDATIDLNTRVEYDYRVLQPHLVTDPNHNRTEYSYTPLGSLKGISVMGKLGEEEGDILSKPSILYHYDFLAFINSPKEKRQPIFVHMFSREEHYWDLIHQENEKRALDRQPPLAEEDIKEMFPEDEPEKFPERFIQSREYSDGFARSLQTRTQAEDILFGEKVDDKRTGNLGLSPNQSDKPKKVEGAQRAKTDPAYVTVSGWQVYDNKEHVVNKYEPFFSAGWEYKQPSEVYLKEAPKVIMFYDSRGNVIRTVNPDGSEQWVVYGVPGRIAEPDLTNPAVFEPTPWEIYTYDANDNADRTHSTNSPTDRLHLNTPLSSEIDALGRTIKTIQRNGSDETDWYTTISSYDIRGNLITLRDALGRTAFRHVFDQTNHLLRIESIDSGIKRIVFDAAGNEIERRDSKGALILHGYDALNRPIRMWARDDDKPGSNVTLRELIKYGDGSKKQSPSERGASRKLNLLGRVYKYYDEAGLISFIPVESILHSKPYDFKGNVLEKVRRVIKDDVILNVFAIAEASNSQVVAYRVNWEYPLSESVLEDIQRQHRISFTYDAMNRVKAMKYPKDVVDPNRRMVLQLHYNRSGALESIAMDNDVYVKRIVYNAKGQRTLVVYGNNVMTRHVYDDKTFRLVHMRTENYNPQQTSSALIYNPVLSKDPFQDFSYDYDLMGNTLVIHDRTPKCGISKPPSFKTDELDRIFIYDPLYRIKSAKGRENVYSFMTLPAPWNDKMYDIDTTLARGYKQVYRYDNVGNLKELKHNALPPDGGGFTRKLSLVSNTNRLDTMEIGSKTYQYKYDKSGNLIQEDSSRYFEWDHTDHMRVYYTQDNSGKPTVYTQYLYDSSGQRVKKIIRKQGANIGIAVETEIVVYIDGAFEYHRLDDTSEVIENNTLHIMDNKNRIALVRIGDPFPDESIPDKAIKYHMADQLGSSNVVIDESGNFLNREEYYPYGETSFGSFARKRYRFTGKERDEESGLYYYGARYYALWLGRWISCDPAGSVCGINLYVGFRSNPIKYIDPDGNETSDAGTPSGGTLITGTEGSIKPTDLLFKSPVAGYTEKRYPESEGISLNNNLAAFLHPGPGEGLLIGGILTLGIGVVLLASGPVGWFVGLSAALAISGGTVGVGVGFSALMLSAAGMPQEAENVSAAGSFTLQIGSSPGSLVGSIIGGTATQDINGMQTGATIGSWFETGALLSLGVVKGIKGGGEKILWGTWDDYPKVVLEGEELALVGDRLYTRHAVDRIQPSGMRFSTASPDGTTGGYPQIRQTGGGYDYGRGVAPQYIEDAIRSSKPVVQQNGNISHTSGTLQVILSPEGNVVTIITH